jgi:hypothetical protein
MRDDRDLCDLAPAPRASFGWRASLVLALLVAAGVFCLVEPLFFGLRGIR